MPVLTRNASKHCAIVNECIRTNEMNEENKSNEQNASKVINFLEGNGQSEEMNENNGSTSSSSATLDPPVSTVDANTLVETLVRQNSMLMELLKAQQNSNKPSNDITIAPDLNKSIPIFNGLGTLRKLLIGYVL